LRGGIEMKVGIILRNGLRYVTGIGNLGDLDVVIVHGELIAGPDSQNTPELSIVIRPKEIVFREQNNEEMVRDISTLNESWVIPLTNIDYFTANEGTVAERKIRGLEWKISFIEGLPDEEEGKGLRITGKQQQLNLLRAELKELMESATA
jgi:hypothetical protein